MRQSAARLMKKIKEGTVTEDDLMDFGVGVCKAAVEESLKTVPNVVNHVTKQMFFLRQLANDFYKKHPDLREYRQLVTDTIEQIEGENPGMTYEKIAELAAQRVHERLAANPGLAEKAKDKEKDNKKAVAKTSRRRIDEALEDL